MTGVVGGVEAAQEPFELGSASPGAVHVKQGAALDVAINVLGHSCSC